MTFLGPQLVPKRLALLKEALPTTSQVAALWHPGAYGERTMNDVMKEAEEAALTLGVHIRLVAVHAPDDLDRAFSTVAAERADPLLILPSPMLFNENGLSTSRAGRHVSLSGWSVDFTRCPQAVHAQGSGRTCYLNLPAAALEILPRKSGRL